MSAKKQGGSLELIEARAEAPRPTRADGENVLRCTGSLVRLLVTGEDTEGRIAVVETLVRKGTEGPNRVHSREDLVVYVLEGTVLFLVDGERLHAPEGRWVSLPRGCEHSYSVESEEARLLMVAVPSGFEGYYRELADRDGASPAGTPAFERLVTVAARYGVEIAVPEAGTGVAQREAGMEQG